MVNINIKKDWFNYNIASGGRTTGLAQEYSTNVIVPIPECGEIGKTNDGDDSPKKRPTRYKICDVELSQNYAK